MAALSTRWHQQWCAMLWNKLIYLKQRIFKLAVSTGNSVVRRVDNSGLDCVRAHARTKNYAT
jgi:hypothetical protein